MEPAQQLDPSPLAGEISAPASKRALQLELHRVRCAAAAAKLEARAAELELKLTQLPGEATGADGSEMDSPREKLLTAIDAANDQLAQAAGKNQPNDPADQSQRVNQLLQQVLTALNAFRVATSAQAPDQRGADQRGAVSHSVVDANQHSGPSLGSDSFALPVSLDAMNRDRPVQTLGERSDQRSHRSESGAHILNDWSTLQAAVAARRSHTADRLHDREAAEAAISRQPHGSSRMLSPLLQQVLTGPERPASSSAAIMDPLPNRSADSPGTGEPQTEIGAKTDFAPATVKDSITDEPQKSNVTDPVASIALPLAADASDARVVPHASEARVVPETRPAEKAKRKREGWIVSLAAHLLVLVCLGLFTLSVQAPRDQVTLSASPSESPSEQMESLELESPETSLETMVPEPTEDVVEVDPLGEIAVAESLDLDSLPDVLADNALDNLNDTLQQALASNQSTVDTNATTTFCGIEGGGNHFVYIIDSSLTMRGERFESARKELLRSVEELHQDQRFYVVFYDSELKRMALHDQNQAETRSVLATPENKRALRRWVTSVQLERGKHPEEVLRFALSLQADAIFLLSDGEFPEHVIDTISGLNQVTNLFGQTRPVSIIHTIGYHSRAGEAKMQAMAAANAGQYRHVPKPR